MKNAPRKPMVSAIIAILVLISPIYAESASNLEKYLDCSSEKKIDIVFVFDTTNSMGGEISELRATANKFATDLEASNIDYQLGLVEFRDFPETCDGFPAAVRETMHTALWAMGHSHLRSAHLAPGLKS